jgi:hypothetical protein
MPHDDFCSSHLILTLIAFLFAPKETTLYANHNISFFGLAEPIMLNVRSIYFLAKQKFLNSFKGERGFFEKTHIKDHLDEIDVIEKEESCEEDGRIKFLLRRNDHKDNHHEDDLEGDDSYEDRDELYSKYFS